MDARTTLLDMVRGTRSGYWVEVLHGEAGDAYMLHFPYANGADSRDMPILPTTWDAVRVEAARHLGDAGRAEQLPKYDDGRKYHGDVMDADAMAALMKWAKITPQEA